MKKDGCEPGEIKMGSVCVPKHCQDIVQTRGITWCPFTAGFIMPDGHMIDVSTEDPNEGTITLPHHEILEDIYPHIYPLYNPKHSTPSDILTDFCDDCHAIRFIFTEPGLGNSLYIQPHHRPTKEQIQTLNQILEEENVEEFNAETSHFECQRSMRPHKMSLIKWIQECWK